MPCLQVAPCGLRWCCAGQHTNFRRSGWRASWLLFWPANQTALSSSEHGAGHSHKHLGTGGALLAALVSGRAAHDFEELSLESILAEVMGVLRVWYEPKGVHVPNPVQVSLDTPDNGRPATQCTSCEHPNTRMCLQHGTRNLGAGLPR